LVVALVDLVYLVALVDVVGVLDVAGVGSLVVVLVSAVVAAAVTDFNLLFENKLIFEIVRGVFVIIRLFFDGGATSGSLALPGALLLISIDGIIFGKINRVCL